MIYKKYILYEIKKTLDKHGPLGRCDSEKICQSLGVNADVLVYMVLEEAESALKSLQKEEEKRVKFEKENMNLQAALYSKYKGNKRDMQAALVSGGMPIAKKSKKSLVDLKLRMSWGATDKELLEEYGISKVTLWRWKKELEEYGVSGKPNKK